MLTFGAATLVMIIVCLNISSLLLVRTQGRDRELAIRGALGASRGRLMGQLVTESLLLAVLGGVAGLAIAHGALGLLTALRPSPTPGFWSSYARALDTNDFRLDARVLAFTLVLTLVAGIMSGLLPALRAYTSGFAARLRGDAGSATAGGRSWTRTRASIVTMEIALAFVLVTAAGLVAASLAKMHREDLGFTASEVTTMRLQLPGSIHSLQQAAQFYDELLQRLSRQPGVVGASLSTGLPVTAAGGTTDFVPEGMTGEDLPTIGVQIISPRHFETLGVPLRTGREFSAADVVGTMPAVISATTANLYWSGENPLGRRAFAHVGAGTEEPVEVVGVVADVQYRGVGEEVGPIVYLPVTRLPRRNLYVNVRTSMPATAAAAAMRSEVARLDPTLAITEIRTMRERVGAATSRARFSAVLVITFAVIAAFLALLGVYSLVAYSVRSRSREFGVRLALGGQPRGIIALMLGDVWRIAAIGIALGLAGAFALARVLQSQLYDVAATDPRALAIVAMLMLAAAGLAAWVPALRILRISALTELMRE
ncbi:MAG TPA: FtsX-like permease family protein [Longimicrobiales bacterium]|nr:FtsX-like permease family protein [Longimicrobiales bacterium]